MQEIYIDHLKRELKNVEFAFQLSRNESKLLLDDIGRLKDQINKWEGLTIKLSEELSKNKTRKKQKE